MRTTTQGDNDQKLAEQENLYRGMRMLRRISEGLLWIVGTVFGVYLIGSGSSYQYANAPLGGGAIIVAASMVCFCFSRQTKP